MFHGGQQYGTSIRALGGTDIVDEFTRPIMGLVGGGDITFIEFAKGAERNLA